MLMLRHHSLAHPQTKTTVCLLLAGWLLFWIDPLLANKFETIGSGVSGSATIKREHVSMIMYAVSGIFLLAGGGSFLIPHNNPFKLDYNNWKQSAIAMIVVGVIALVIALVV